MVLHPLIDAVIAIRNRDIDTAAVDEIALRVNPLVLSITGVVEPSTGLQSKFSTVHSAAVALIDGMAGTAQYTDAKATDPAVAALRRKVKAIGRRRRCARTRPMRLSPRAANAMKCISRTPAAPRKIR